MKSHTIKFRVSEEDLLEFDQLANSAKLTRSEFIRKNTIGRRPIIVPESNLKIALELNKIGVNLNQIARKVNSQKSREFIEDLNRLVSQTIRELNGELAKIKQDLEQK